MVMSYVWVGMVALSLLTAAFGGALPALTAALFDGAESAVTLLISLAGVMCLWCGVLRAMDACGISDRLAALLRPFLRLLFPQSADDPETMRSLSGNFTANLLGLGNAATPLGIKTVQRMKHRARTNRATNEMCRLIVMNTASIQLLPTTVAAVRASLGAASPLDILPAVWLSSVCSVAAGLLAAKLMEGREDG